MRITRNQTASIFIALIACLLLRAWTLEYPDLIDPTESRYAFIAQEMVVSGDWLTPKLPWHGEIEPYDGKPPFHFWLTALSFSLFGMDEWVARLPSFLSLCVIIVALLSLRKIPLLEEAAPRAPLILVSSTLMYFMSGSSVIDVTLAGCTTVTVITFIHLFFGKINRNIAAVLLALSAGCGFLTKGPIAIAIVGLPLFVHLVVTRELSILKKIPWLLSICLFLLIVSPWFILAERAHPGFLEYFFINENFKRYLFAEYGDRYGSGHQYPKGTIWLFLSAAFLPWTLFFIPRSVSPRSWIASIKAYAQPPVRLFVLSWAIAPLVIFTFAKQIHAGYLIPALPGLALVCASLFGDQLNQRTKKLLQHLPSVLAILSLAVIVFSLFWGINFQMLILSLPIIIALVILYRYVDLFSKVAVLSLSAVIAYSISTLALSQGLSERKSAEPILRCITHHATEKPVVVGIIDANNYSLYYYSRAWQGELDSPVTIQFLKSESLPDSLPNDILIRTKDADKLTKNLPGNYKTLIGLGRWTWLREGGHSIEVSECPDEK